MKPMSKSVDAYCDDCIYLVHFSSQVPHCDYIGIMGRSRGCPPGEGCRRKEKVHDQKAKKKTTA